MPRILGVALSLSLFVSACASPVAKKTEQTYAPEAFYISDVSVGVDNGIISTPNLEHDLLHGAGNLAKAYNLSTKETKREYILDITVNDVKMADSWLNDENLNKLQYTAKLLDARTKQEYRRVPVEVKNSYEVESHNHSAVEKSLIRTSLPKIFNGLYGLKQTPPGISSYAVNGEIFEQPKLPISPLFSQSNQEASLDTPIALPEVIPSGGASSEVLESDAEDTENPSVIECTVCN
ncbi:MAG: hypothetical protein AAGF54_15990 [Pseudomonadota bacterium]